MVLLVTLMACNQLGMVELRTKEKENEQKTVMNGLVWRKTNASLGVDTFGSSSPTAEKD